MSIGHIHNNAEKDLRRALRDPTGLLIWLAIPLLIGGGSRWPPAERAGRHRKPRSWLSTRTTVFRVASS